ncbi:MAG TPA: hypothetical protein VM166_05920 [Gemmatimonadaceae bacterium]|nr:hypothetical protein [Gemmatimonadaceae bacterium]
MTLRLLCGFSAAILATAACAKDTTDDHKRDLTQREKDSILGASQIPGAKAVNRAMTSADSATARAMRLDSAQKEP